MSCNRLFLGTAVLYTQRVCISVAAAPGAKARNATAVGGVAQNATVTMFSEFGWTNTDQGIVLGAFFNGYIFTQIVGGLLSKRYGGKLVLLACITLSSLFTALTPLAANYSFRVLVACRCALGAVEGVGIPATMSMLAEWAAPSERSLAAGFVFAGSYCGNVGTFAVAGIAPKVDLFYFGIKSLLTLVHASGWLLRTLGWRSIFYTISVAGMVWVAAFAVLTSASPQRALRHLLLPLHPSELATLAPSPRSEGGEKGGGGTDAHASGNEGTGGEALDEGRSTHSGYSTQEGEGVAMEEEGLLADYAEDGPEDQERWGARTVGARRERGKGGGGGVAAALGSVPWRKIARSPPCWAIFAGHTAFNLSFYLMLTQVCCSNCFLSMFFFV